MRASGCRQRHCSARRRRAIRKTIDGDIEIIAIEDCHVDGTDSVRAIRVAHLYVGNAIHYRRGVHGFGRVVIRKWADTTAVSTGIRGADTCGPGAATCCAGTANKYEKRQIKELICCSGLPLHTTLDPAKRKRTDCFEPSHIGYLHLHRANTIFPTNP